MKVLWNVKFWTVYHWLHKILCSMISKALQTNVFVTQFTSHPAPSNFPSLQVTLTVTFAVGYRPVSSFNPCRTSRQFPCRKISDQILEQVKAKSKLTSVHVASWQFLQNVGIGNTKLSTRNHRRQCHHFVDFLLVM